jgi:ribonuclease HI/mannose-6-phosphate isomerase-like protein (cupin superfamily)
MEIHDATTLLTKMPGAGRGVSTARLHPIGQGPAGGGLLAVDLWELDPGASTPVHEHAEEHVLFVIAGTGELRGSAPGDRGVAVLLRPNSVAYITPYEPHTLRNTGSDKLRVLVSTPMLVWSQRALGREWEQERPTMPGQVQATSPAPRPAQEHAARQAEAGAETGVGTGAETHAGVLSEAPAGAGGGGEHKVESVEGEPLPDISKLVRRASEIQPVPRERRRPAPEEPIAGQAGSQAGQQEPAVEEEEGPGSMLELLVVFDGGSRGNPGQGYGSFLVQSPGRRPVIRRLEFGDNYTNNQAEYDTLIACLNYIIERLTATGRSPSQVLLDIRTDSELVVNQLLGTYKVKDASMKKRYQQAMELLEQFADWRIEWQPRDETVRLLGH